MAETEDDALADRLRELREHSWPSVTLTQGQLARVFGVNGGTISAWESTTNPKRPTARRIEAYARFFATPRSLDGEPHLLPENDLAVEERDRYDELEDELLTLLNPPDRGRRDAELATVDVAGHSAVGRTFAFRDGPVTVICAEAPVEERGPLAEAQHPNFTRLQRYGDLDALIEMYGHLRAANPTLDIYHRHAGEVTADDLSTHIVLIGGIAWNKVTKRVQDATRQVPITQIEVADFPGDIFEVAADDDDTAAEPVRFYPEWEDDDEGHRDLVEDVALIVRLPNPFNGRRTLTICNGIHSRGVYGAVRCLTDRRVREANEHYLADRFPAGRFAVLVRVPVVANETMSPDLQNATARLYEWPAPPGDEE